MVIRIGIQGIGGRMGGEIVALANADKRFELIGGLASASGVDVAARSYPRLLVTDSPPTLLAKIDVLIDFSTPGASILAAEACANAGVALVCGTTGLSSDQLVVLERASIQIPVFYARNMSIGVSALLAALPGLVRSLTGYDIEITETHHRNKVDAPSGTAHAIGEVIAAVREEQFEALAVHGRRGVSPRQPGEIGVHSLRGGGNSGEHVVLFASDGEEITITHRALSRRTFAAGALRAAEFVHGRVPGFYTMADLIGTGG